MAYFLWPLKYSETAAGSKSVLTTISRILSRIFLYCLAITPLNVCERERGGGRGGGRRERGMGRVEGGGGRGERGGGEGGGRGRGRGERGRVRKRGRRGRERDGNHRIYKLMDIVHIIQLTFQSGTELE